MLGSTYRYDGREQCSSCWEKAKIARPARLVENRPDCEGRRTDAKNPIRLEHREHLEYRSLEIIVQLVVAVKQNCQAEHAVHVEEIQRTGHGAARRTGVSDTRVMWPGTRVASMPGPRGPLQHLVGQHNQASHERSTKENGSSVPTARDSHTARLLRPKRIAMTMPSMAVRTRPMAIATM